jgi:hypothetical protein
MPARRGTIEIGHETIEHDEIEAAGRRRGQRVAAGGHERERAGWIHAERELDQQPHISLIVGGKNAHALR